MRFSTLHAMSLQRYKDKRSFEKTPEPEGRKKSSKGALRFVVQKHDASHLHYDFRLEMEGVLKSWAIPKGPSLNPADKRLAMAVEDHPYDYRNFEGIIPAGNYGGGTVIVWDEGTYEPVDGEDMNQKEQEKLLLKQWREGSLKLVMKGEKLKGEFALFLMKGRGERSWILMKKKDRYATVKNVLSDGSSVKTGKTLADVAEAAGTTLNHPEEKTKRKEKTPPVQLLHSKPSKKAAKKTALKKTMADPPKASKRATPKKGKGRAPKKSIKTSGLVLDLDAGKEQEIMLNRHTLQLTNLDKLYWKKEKFSKGDMLNYYLQIAPYLLPYMLDRPQSLNRHPNGITGSNFYQKDVKGKVPDWMQTHTDFSESTKEDVNYLVCSNEATLIYMANLGCIEMHPWHSRTAAPQQPDWCLIDLDPDKGNTFEEVMETARVVKSILDAIGADAYCKTSGSTGLHICIPLGAKYSYDQSKQLAELVVTLTHQELPHNTSLERAPSKRKGKIYLDYLQNRETQTAAAPYSLRPKPGVPVSTPLDWSELKKGLTPATWHARNIFDRLNTVGDLFKPVLGKGIDLAKVLRTLATQLP